MTTLRAIAWTLLLASAASTLPAQDRKEPEEAREVRIYLIDRVRPERDFKDAAASVTIEHPSRRGRTILFPWVAKGTPAPGEKLGPGMIRGLPTSPYFVELNFGEAAAALPDAVEKKPAGPAEPPKEPSGREILRRVHHKGGCFVQKVPVDLLRPSFTATVTIRLGNLTFTSEEFQAPPPENGAPEKIAERVEKRLDDLLTRAGGESSFMDLRPAAVELMRELARLAPAGFEDGSGAFEIHRQWCLSRARAIEQACYDGDAERIVELGRQVRPRLKEMESIAAGLRKEKPPEPPSEVPVK